MSDDDKTPLQRGYAMVAEIDDLYFKVYIEWCGALNKCPVGPPGIQGFDTLEQMAEHVKSRHVRIKQMLFEIEEVKTAKVEDKELLSQMKTLVEDVRGV